jgi:hypothetical protein
VFWLIVLVNICLAITYVTFGYKETAKLTKIDTFDDAFGDLPTFLNVFTSMTIMTPWLSLIVLIDA